MIELSVCPIAHPIVCVMKSDKTVRMCCDNRSINSISIPDRPPMRRGDDILDQVGAATYISAFDASSGYWQIGVQEESRPYTAFVFDQAYQWKRFNFGLKNAAATYQRAMEKILTPHSKYATAYIDDVSVYSMTWKEHLQHMYDVLQTILRSGFKLRLSECKFAQRQIKLLGQIVGNMECDNSIQRKFEWCWKSNLRHRRKKSSNSLVSCRITGFSFRICQNYRIVSLNSQKGRRTRI